MNRVKINVLNVVANVIGLALVCLFLCYLAGSKSVIGLGLCAVLCAFTSILMQGASQTVRLYEKDMPIGQLFKDSTLITFSALLITWNATLYLLDWPAKTIITTVIIYMLLQQLLIHATIHFFGKKEPVDAII